MNILKTHMSIFWIALILLGIATLFATAGSAEAANGLYAQRLHKVWDHHELEPPMSPHISPLYGVDAQVMKPCNLPEDIQAHQSLVGPDLFYCNDNIRGIFPSCTRSGGFTQSFQKKRKPMGRTQ